MSVDIYWVICWRGAWYEDAMGFSFLREFYGHVGSLHSTHCWPAEPKLGITDIGVTRTLDLTSGCQKQEVWASLWMLQIWEGFLGYNHKEEIFIPWIFYIAKQREGDSWSSGFYPPQTIFKICLLTQQYDSIWVLAFIVYWVKTPGYLARIQTPSTCVS